MATVMYAPDERGMPPMLQAFPPRRWGTVLPATLTHPNTVQVFDYGQASDGTVFYAMEYLTDPSLEQLVSTQVVLSPRVGRFSCCGKSAARSQRPTRSG